MHYGIRITTKVYKKLDTNPIQYIIDALTRWKGKNSVYKTSTEQSA